jgi:hypothetical protein
MTSDRHLALMALMNEIEEPAKIYQRQVRAAANLASETPEWDSAVERGNRALDLIERAVRLWVESNAPQPLPGRCGTPSPDGRFVCALKPHTNAELHADRPRKDAEPNGRRMVWQTPVALPEGFQRKTCVTVACAVCGYPYDEAEFTMHFPSAAEASNHVVSDGWDELKDGRVLCMRGDEKHDETRRTVGLANRPAAVPSV